MVIRYYIVAFNTVLCKTLFQGHQGLWVTSEIIWAICAIYKKVKGRVHCFGGSSETIANAIGVKPWCPLPLIVSGICLDEIFYYIAYWGRGCELQK